MSARLREVTFAVASAFALASCNDSHVSLVGPAGGELGLSATGDQPTRLTFSPGRDFLAVWSPNRTRIAFASERDGNFEIYVMNTDGSGATNLTNSPS